jgi:hypothetical protein
VIGNQSFTCGDEWADPEISRAPQRTERVQIGIRSEGFVTMSPHSPKALYHPIPQAPVAAANPAVLSDLYLEESQDGGGLDPDTPLISGFVYFLDYRLTVP